MVRAAPARSRFAFVVTSARSSLSRAVARKIADAVLSPRDLDPAVIDQAHRDLAGAAGRRACSAIAVKTDGSLCAFRAAARRAGITVALTGLWHVRGFGRVEGRRCRRIPVAGFR
jgi:hypothetical protein